MKTFASIAYWSLLILAAAAPATWVAFTIVKIFGASGNCGALLAVVIAMPLATILFALYMWLIRRLKGEVKPGG